MSAKKDFTIKQGSTFRHHLYVKQKIDKNTFTPVNLTGCVPRMQIRPSIGSSVVILDLKVNNFISITDPQEGKITIEIPPNETQILDFNYGVYDIEILFENGDVIRFLEGKVRLSPEVTR